MGGSMAQEEAARRTPGSTSEGELPIIVVWDGMLAVPIIGILDSDRTLKLTERLLETVAQDRARVVLLDITGVLSMDTPTAQHLIDLVSALRLLGTRVIITGIRPEVAQTLVHLGITLADVRTESTLATGVELGLRELGYRVVEEEHPVAVGES